MSYNFVSCNFDVMYTHVDVSTLTTVGARVLKPHEVSDADGKRHINHVRECDIIYISTVPSLPGKALI